MASPWRGGRAWGHPAALLSTAGCTSTGLLVHCLHLPFGILAFLPGHARHLGQSLSAELCDSQHSQESCTPHSASSLGCCTLFYSSQVFPRGLSCWTTSQDLHRYGNFEPRGVDEDDFIEGEQNPLLVPQRAAELYGLHLGTGMFQDIYREYIPI